MIPALADWYSVDIREPRSGEVRRIHVDHRDPSKVAMAQLLARKYPDTRHDQGVHAVLRSGKTEWLREIPEEMIERAAQNPEHLAMLQRLGLRSYVLVPLSVRGTIYGALTLVTAESGRLYNEEDVALAEELGKRAGQAVENARLFREIDNQRKQLEEQQAELEAQTAELEETAQALSQTNAQLELSVDALRDRTREADEANKAKSDFLAAMSHELRTPLNAILGYVDLLTILINLLGNAVRYTPEGGEITISCDRDRRTIRMRVCDTGSGIPAHKLEAIFEPFVQVESARDAQRQGTGLGLSISRDLARAMQGDVTVESELGRGTTFSVRRPAAD